MKLSEDIESGRFYIQSKYKEIIIERIKELEAQIEKMKCCENCETWKINYRDNGTLCNECEGSDIPFSKWRGGSNET